MFALGSEFSNHGRSFSAYSSCAYKRSKEEAHGKSWAKTTSCMECVSMQSRKAVNMMLTRLSKAVKCGSHKTGETGSLAIDSLINCDSGFGPLWNLKPSKQTSQMRFNQPPKNTRNGWKNLPQKCFECGWPDHTALDQWCQIVQLIVEGTTETSSCKIFTIQTFEHGWTSPRWFENHRLPLS